LCLSSAHPSCGRNNESGVLAPRGASLYPTTPFFQRSLCRQSCLAIATRTNAGSAASTGKSFLSLGASRPGAHRARVALSRSPSTSLRRTSTERSVGVVHLADGAPVSARVCDSEQHKRDTDSEDDGCYRSFVIQPLSEAPSRHAHSLQPAGWLALHSSGARPLLAPTGYDR
jgi:hypothetical protein